MPESRPDYSPLRILAVTQAQWGERIAENIGRNLPKNWTVTRWAAPKVLPQIVDDPDDYLPASFPPADLVLALGDTPGVAALIPDIVQRSGARAVIAPIDRNESLPPGLANQLRGWLADLQVPVVFPKPFCSLTETTYNQPPIMVRYDNALIRAFAAVFGRPEFQVAVDAEKRVQAVAVTRDSACGCGRHVAAGLAGCPINDAEEKAGLLHHHYPCLASMNQDADYRDTLMHVSGNLVRAAIKAELAEHLEITYLRPQGRLDD
ncbi:MAG: hypothetical protein JNK29_04220 [Anaerolineales bacterium]|nr:hypothetical protein [Anaerolineales bacterium]